MIYQYFIGGMMPDSANPVQQSVTVIEIRPFKGGWQCYEARVSDLTGLAILQSRAPPITPKRVQSSDVERFGYSGKTDR
jgi:hypothetical protein